MKYSWKSTIALLLCVIMLATMVLTSCDKEGSDDGKNDQNQSENTDNGNDTDTDGGNTDGGNTDSGNTDGGNDDGGNTDSGNTDGGNDDGGNTDSGNTDGGNTDGGNTDSGNTDGGNDDGGNTDSGNTDGGNDDGGNTDSGNTDGGNDDGGNTGGEGGNTGNEGNEDQNPEDTSIVATSVSLSKNTLSLLKGANETLIATIAPDDTTDKTLTWTTSDASVATVENGTVTAVGAGTATITVTTANGKTATCNVTVTVEASAVSLNKNTLSLIKDGSETLIATIAPDDTTDKALTWTTSDETVATVDNGTVTAVGAGTATISVTTANGKTATCNVTVTVEASGVTLDKNSIRINAGEDNILTATIAPNDTTDKTLTWTTSDASVATVENGTVTAVGAGTATITVTTANGKTATCNVTVTVEASAVSLSKNTLSLLKGANETLTATIVPDDTTNKALTWTTSDASVATVENGTVTAVGAGTATITVTTANGKTATCNVTVTVEASGVTLDKNSIRINAGEDNILTATIAPNDTTDKTLTWTTSDETVATVENGTVTAVGAGTATITVTTANGKTATCQVTVIANGIGFRTLAVTGTNVYGKLPNTTAMFSFVDEVSVSGNATFEVYRDLECEDIITDKIATLNPGDNTFYICEYIGGEVNALYTVTIRRRPMYTVTFDTKGGTDVTEQIIEEDGFVVVPTTTKAGYTFAGWDTDLTLPITDGKTVSAQWIGNHYLVTYDANNGSLTNTTTNVVMGSDFTLEIPTRIGYTFAGWYNGTTPMALTGTWNIAENVTLKAEWTANTNTAYRVEHYIEKLDGSYELRDTDNLEGTSDSQITPDTKNYEGFTAPTKQTVTVLPDGSQVVRYNYTRNSYTVTFVTNGGIEMTSQTLKYEQALSSEATRDGFTFGGWFKDETLGSAFVTMPAENITLYAYWTEENKPSDFNYLGSNEITIDGYVGSDVTVVIPEYIGGKPVTSIGDGAFEDCSEISSVSIPSGVTRIGDSAFKNCSNLTTINFDGTETQWNAISKGTNWNAATGNYTVYFNGGSGNEEVEEELGKEDVAPDDNFSEAHPII